MARRKTKADELDQLAAMGQESETKAVKHVQEYGREQKAGEEKFEAGGLEELNYLRRFGRANYHHRLRDIIAMVMNRTLEVPLGWDVAPFFDDKGAGVLLKHAGRKFVRAFKPSGEPKYDLNACSEMVKSAQDFVDEAAKEEITIHA